MAWQPYVNEMMKNGSMSGSAVCGINGAMWAVSPGFSLQNHSVQQMQEDGSSKTLTVNEPALLVESTNGQMSSTCGLYINKQKYLIVNHNPGTGSVYIKSKTGGGCLVKTKQCILIGLYTTGQGNNGPGNCNRDTEDLAEKLKAVGY